jgi:class 3 adenylate cyclase/YHS domain-containing protein
VSEALGTVADGGLGTREATFIFADIAGFTALTEAHGDEQAAELVAEFCRAVQAQLPDSGGSQVKSIGDALMLRIPEPGAAIRLGLRIAHGIMRDHGAPAVRVGLHHGPALERDGDYFGAAVNLAARVSGQAVGGEVLMSAHTAALAGELDGVLYESRGRRQLRNVREPIELVAAVPADVQTTRRVAIDPVCQMAVDPEHAAGRLIYDEKAYFFCALSCAGDFARHPERFVGSP